MGRWPPCSPTRHASKEWLLPSKEVCTRTVEAAYGQREGGSADGSECRHGPAHGVRVTSLLSHYGATASEVLSGRVRDAPPDRRDGRCDAILISLYPELDDKEYENRFLGIISEILFLSWMVPALDRMTMSRRLALTNARSTSYA
jgi:hypothetical protein